MFLSLCDIHYVAGFLEGEGSFSIRGKVDPAVSATQADREPLEKLSALFGGHIYPCKPNRVSKKPLWVWNLNGKQAVGLMMTIYCLMTQRRQQQIQVVLLGWRSRTRVRCALCDSEALALMRRACLQEEPLYKIAASVGMEYTAIRHWLAGKNRPHLREQLIRELGIETVAKIDARRAWYSMEGDDRALMLLRQAVDRRANGEGLRAISQSLGVAYETIRDWLKGKKRPHLLAQLQQEADAAKEDS